MATSRFFSNSSTMFMEHSPREEVNRRLTEALEPWNDPRDWCGDIEQVLAAAQKATGLAFSIESRDCERGRSFAIRAVPFCTYLVLVQGGTERWRNEPESIRRLAAAICLICEASLATVSMIKPGSVVGDPVWNSGRIIGTIAAPSEPGGTEVLVW